MESVISGNRNSSTIYGQQRYSIVTKQSSGIQRNIIISKISYLYLNMRVREVWSKVIKQNSFKLKHIIYRYKKTFDEKTTDLS